MEEGLHTVYFHGNFNTAVQCLIQMRKSCNGIRILCIQCRTNRSKEMGIIRCDNMFRCQIQISNKGILKF